MNPRPGPVSPLSGIEGPCPRCGRPLKSVHTVSQYGRPSVALMECPHCRYTCQAVIPGLWPEEAFPRASRS